MTFLLPTAFLNQLRPTELIIIAFIILLLFGAKRLPELFRSFGKSLREFKKATQDIEDEVRNAMDSEEDTQTPAKKEKASTPASSNGKAETTAQEKN